jgi:subtilisin family serine protease
MNLSIILSLIILIITIINGAKNNNNNNDNNNNNKKDKNMKSMKPNKYSRKYDPHTVALEFDDDCLNGNDPQEQLQKLMEIYSCLSNKEVYEDNNIFRHHGKIHRTYLNIINNENGDGNDETNNCLYKDGIEIDWNEYCISDISYDMILYLEGTCIDDITNSIYYGTIKKYDAWSVDMLDSTGFDSKYKYPNIAGSDNGIDIWILDSGIYASHNEFFPGQIIDEVGTYTYTSKHGTNSASVAGGMNYGSSRGFYIHDYIVCRNTDGGCSFSDIEKGLQAVLSHMKTTGRRSVINMSIGSSGANNYASTKTYYENLFQDILNAGGIITVSAGNGGADACNWWFSYSDKVISVGAHDKSKNRSSFSNYGACVDIYAPGSLVPAANSISDPAAVGYVSGTSFSSPIMAGVVANLLYEDRTRTKDQIVAMLKSTSQRYSIGSCTTGYCYGYYYKCNILAPQEVEEQVVEEQEEEEEEDVVLDNDDNDEQDQKEDNEMSNVGCCKSIRDLVKLNNYCSSLLLNQCLNNDNIKYCYVDTSC